LERDPRAYLWEVKQAAAAIGEFTAGLNFIDYEGSELVRSAVERKFEIIGEALSQLSKFDPAMANRLSEARRAVDFRNQLIHGYRRIDHAEVWAVVQTDLPKLLAAVTALLDQLGPP